MKAYHNYTTAMTTAIRLRWGTAILLTLAALIVGLMLLLSSNKQSTTSTSTSASSVRHVSEALVSCRACRDEWAAAQAAQPVGSAATSHTQAIHAPATARATGLLASCRACRDEWVTAQAPIIPSGGVDFDQPKENFRTSGPR